LQPKKKKREGRGKGGVKEKKSKKKSDREKGGCRGSDDKIKKKETKITSTLQLK
jgi:hypothetical protein